MALSITARGTGGDAVSSASVVVTPSGNMAAGSLGVLVLALDNMGAGGSVPATSTPLTDSAGNIWHRQIDFIRDPGAAGDGVELTFYIAFLSTTLTTGGNLTVPFSPNVPSKAWALWEITAGAGLVPAYVTGANGSQSSTNAPTVTTASIPSGDAIIAGLGKEGTGAMTADADTTNGSWTAQQSVAFGTGLTGLTVGAQGKVVTATATQTYNPTWTTAADQCNAWIQLHEDPALGRAAHTGGGYYP